MGKWVCKKCGGEIGLRETKPKEVILSSSFKKGEEIKWKYYQELVCSRCNLETIATKRRLTQFASWKEDEADAVDIYE